MSEAPPIVRVLVALPLEDELVERIQAVSPQVKVSVSPDREIFSEEAWRRAEVLFTWKVLPAHDQAPRLRWIQYYLAGTEKLIEAEISKKPDLIVTSMSGANAPQVAEHAVGMLLALGRQMPQLMKDQQESKWSKTAGTRFEPLNLRGSTVGIVGYGSIGRQIARLLRPFGCVILASKRNAMDPTDNGYAPDGAGDPQGEFFDRLYPGKTLRAMFKECDFVVVTVPLTKETNGMIGAEQLASLREGAYLVDVSRGGVIDHEALVEALQNETLAGASLDVFPEEPLPEESPLWKMPNVILTPHIAGISPHYDRQAVDLFCENLRRYLNNEPLYNRVDLERGY
jgi:phosphoglycerate dehydrogenase-like enzyme